jgi:uncharacterized membrane protein required for colicin V production
VNAADLVLALVLLGFVVAGLRHGVIGLLLLALATGASLVGAGLVALWVASQSAIPGPGLLVAIPVAFVLTLSVAGVLLRFLARRFTGLAHRLPVAALDRLLGAVVSATVAVVIASIAILAAFELPRESRVSRVVASARLAPVLVGAGARFTQLAAGPLPVLRPLAARLEAVHDELRTLKERPAEA